MSRDKGSPSWSHLGEETVSGSRRIQIPEEVFDHDILRRAGADRAEASTVGDAHWSYDTATGWVIISDRPLSKDLKTQEGRLVEGEVEVVRYKTPNGKSRTKPLGENNANQVTIPKRFFDDGIEGVPDAVQFTPNEYRHFVTAAEFLTDTPNETKSCYLLTTDQLNSILQNDYHPGGDDTPQFV
jgi:hypothetical protein